MNDAKDDDKDDGGAEDDSINRSLAQGLKNNSRGWMEAEVVFIFPVELLWKRNFVNQL